MSSKGIMRVHVVGGTTFDMFAKSLPHLPREDEAGDEFTDISLVRLPSPFVPCVGGNGGNAAIAFSRLGTSVALCTAFATDVFGRWLAEQLNSAGVQVEHLPATDTSVNVVLIDEAAHRLSAFRPVELALADTISAAEAADVRPGDILLLAGYPHPHIEAMAAWTRRAAHAGATVALDIGPALAGLTEVALESVLPAVDILLANEAELAGMVPRTPAEDVATRLAHTYSLAAVMKRGLSGSRYVSVEHAVDVPSFPAEGAITVGAGDAFNAGVLHRLAEGVAPAAALRYGAAVSALVIERGRGVLGAPSAKEIDSFIQETEERTAS